MNPDRVIASTVPVRLGEALHRRDLLVLSYHGVEDPEQLRAQLAWLRTRRTPVSLDEVAGSVRSGRPMGRPSFLVTFDDGRRSVLEHGLPVLESLGIPGALFVVAGLVGTDQPYWWDEADELSRAGGRTDVAAATGPELVRALKQVPDQDRLAALEDLRATASARASRYRHLGADELRELDSRGLAIGSHSMTHPCLDKCPPEQVARELDESRTMLTDLLGRPVDALAYPNGNRDQVVVDAAAAAGYRLGFLFDHRLSSCPPRRPLEISRVRVDSTTTLARFRAITSGVHPAIHRARGLG